jgi:hypothetical protein
MPEANLAEEVRKLRVAVEAGFTALLAQMIQQSNPKEGAGDCAATAIAQVRAILSQAQK